MHFQFLEENFWQETEVFLGGHGQAPGYASEHLHHMRPEVMLMSGGTVGAANPQLGCGGGEADGGIVIIDIPPAFLSHHLHPPGMQGPPIVFNE